MYKVVICDNERDVRKWLEGKLEQHYGNRLNISTYANSEGFHEEGNLKEKQETDIILMDLRLKDANGIETVSKIQETGRVKIIFTVGDLDDAKNVMKINPCYLLKKPLSEAALYEVMDQVMALIDAENEQSYTVLFQGMIRRVRVSDIFYFESVKRTVVLHGKQGDFVTYKKLSEVEEELSDPFLRCHQSYLVNMNQIESFCGNEITLYQGEKIPVSRVRVREAREKFMRFIGEIL